MIRITAQTLQRIKQHAGDEQPAEACGYLAGVNNIIDTVYPMTNADHSPVHFAFDPREQFKAVKAAREAGRKILACYHSHPTGAAYMSAEDLRLAYNRELLYIIYAIIEDKIGVFKVNEDGAPETIKMEVIP